MSRSRKKNPYHSITISGGRSKVNKNWRSSYNRAIRKMDKSLLSQVRDDHSIDLYEDKTIFSKDQISSEWDSPRDGKTYNPDWVKSWRK
jgi:hypothetical protein